MRASVRESRYFTITGVDNDSPHSGPLPPVTDRAPGTTTAAWGMTSGRSDVGLTISPRTRSYTGVDPVRIVPAAITAKLRIEKKGRGGKTVTVVDGLPNNAAFLDGLARDLKRACGVGGSVHEGAIELQGDCRENVRRILTQRGHKVRG